MSSCGAPNRRPTDAVLNLRNREPMNTLLVDDDEVGEVIGTTRRNRSIGVPFPDRDETVCENAGSISTARPA